MVSILGDITHAYIEQHFKQYKEELMEENLFTPRRMEGRPEKRRLLEEKDSKERIDAILYIVKTDKVILWSELDDLQTVDAILKNEGFSTEITPKEEKYSYTLQVGSAKDIICLYPILEYYLKIN